MKKLVIAGVGAAALGLSVMPMVGVFAAGNGSSSVVDTIKVNLSSACTFSTGNSGVTEDTTYTATSATNGSLAVFSNASHKFNVVCNDPDGYKVTATATDLKGTNPSNVFSYTNGELSGADGLWKATVTAGTHDAPTTSAIAGNGGTIVTLGHDTAGSDFTVNYSVWVGTSAIADLYEGTMPYQLSAL